eukprot:TRINITY_DN4750_c0_g1_i2.p1 TRINITY_DN4750_c0_g1~~TRINITY_DN4750_c0_g1_i2.p1  ORF type:complete len:265 (+),score=50.51 TRINITY_DN4750_c0_g1_i2:248-1042(+)
MAADATLPTILLGLCASSVMIKPCIAATCSFTNAHPDVAVASLALYDEPTGPATVTSTAVGFGHTAYLTCKSGVTQYVRAFNGSDTVALVFAQTTAASGGFKCQARNLMSLEPLAWNQTGATLDLTSLGEVAEGTYNLGLVNSGYDGDLVWSEQVVGVGGWTEIGTTTGFNGARVLVRSFSGDVSLIVKAEAINGPEVARSSVFSITSADTGMGAHVHLIEASGVSSLVFVRGCGTAGDNCNACEAGEDFWTCLLYTSPSPRDS